MPQVSSRDGGVMPVDGKLRQEQLMQRDPWVRAGFDAWILGIESISVIALRTLKIAAGGVAAEAEAFRMVSEKIESGLALQALALTGGLGFTAESAATKTLAHYRSKVRANRRRLIKE
jgi:hypothetical protein